ncbi:hypothetical protein AWB81_01626 [Caballeronia arationis]|nr:hypothetical protein AWB81_01626 [Caballeronia arationis]
MPASTRFCSSSRRACAVSASAFSDGDCGSDVYSFQYLSARSRIMRARSMVAAASVVPARSAARSNTRRSRAAYSSVLPTAIALGIWFENVSRNASLERLMPTRPSAPIAMSNAPRNAIEMPRRALIVKLLVMIVLDARLS